MEPIRLSGTERREWEQRAIQGTARSRQLVFRVLLDFAAGKASCWPANATVAKIAGVDPRTVQRCLRSLEAAGAIRCVEAMDLPSQRLVVLLRHPGTERELRQRAAPRGKMSPPPTTGRKAKGGGMSPQDQKEREEKSVADGRSSGPPDRDEEPWLAVMKRFFPAAAENPGG